MSTTNDKTKVSAISIISSIISVHLIISIIRYGTLRLKYLTSAVKSQL